MNIIWMKYIVLVPFYRGAVVFDGLLIKKEKKKFKADPVIVAAFISTLGFVGVSIASMKYEDDGNIIQHTAGKTAMNKLGR